MTATHPPRKEPGVNKRRIFSTAAAMSTAAASLGLAFASPASAVVFNCGDIISAPGTYVLTADVGSAGTPCSTDRGLGITSAGVTLDLNGHTIWGNGLQPADTSATW